ncbi:hypothetical protein M0R01_04685 [bacterium]|nr:hypothetical protein [bacterium]
MLKKYLFLIVSFLLIPVSFSFAMAFSNGEKVSIQSPIEGNAFLTGSIISIDNEIKGDTFAFGEKIYINGNISGDLICAAKEVVINGYVNGNIRCAFQEMRVRGEIERSVLGLGEKVYVEKNSTIGRDFIFAGSDTTIDGTVRGSLDVNSSVLTINGEIDQNINYYSEENNDVAKGLFVNSGSSIKGNVNYNAFGDVKGSGSNVILGSVNKYTPSNEIKKDIKSEIISTLGFLVSLILSTLAIVLIGGKYLKDLTTKMSSSIWSSVGIGAIAFFALPLLGILLLISNIGAYLGFICFLIWLIIILLAVFFAGISFGKLINEKLFKNRINNFALTSILGILLGYILFVIPVLGFIVFVFALWWGIGGMILSFAEKRKED